MGRGIIFVLAIMVAACGAPAPVAPPPKPPAVRRERLCRETVTITFVGRHDRPWMKSYETRLVEDGAGDIVEYDFGDHHRVLVYDGRHHLVRIDTAIWHRDAEGRVTSAEEGETVETVTSRHANGRWKTREKRESGVLTAVSAREFDAQGRPIRRVTREGPHTSEVLTTYEGTSRVVTTRSLGRTTKVTYDAAGHMTDAAYDDVTLHTTFDDRGLPIETRWSSGQVDVSTYEGDCIDDSRLVFMDSAEDDAEGR